MKNITLFNLIVLIVSCPGFIIGMERKEVTTVMTGIEYRHAISDDVAGVVQLVAKHAYKDTDKIVIVPEKFRASYIQNAIDTRRLFVASCGKKIIGYKKLFCITDQGERNDILNNELRCKEETLAGYELVPISDCSSQELASVNSTKLRSRSVTYIYNGADFTHPRYRKRGVNANLTRCALNAISFAVIKESKYQKATYLAMVYGLTRFNAGRESDLLDGRTRSIVKEFISFAKEITDELKCADPSHLMVSRYHAFMPSFDPKATACIPLPDEHSVPGYGYLITCALDQKPSLESNDHD